MYRFIRLQDAFKIISVSALIFISLQAKSADFPPLPANLKSKGLLKVGIRCDQPPYGFLDTDRKNAGIEVEMARQISAWAFGDASKLELTCVTAENRISQLTAGRVDLLIATLGITPERERVIDFSKPYRWGASGVIVKTDSAVKKMADLTGLTVVTPKGSVQAQWLEANMPTVTTLRLNTTSDSLQAFKQGRADAYAHDAATLVILASHDKSLRILDDPYQYSYSGIGIRKGEADWKAFIDASLERMKADSMYIAWVKKWAPPDVAPYYINVFQSPRPDGK